MQCLAGIGTVLSTKLYHPDTQLTASGTTDDISNAILAFHCREQHNSTIITEIRKINDNDGNDGTNIVTDVAAGTEK